MIAWLIGIWMAVKACFGLALLKGVRQRKRRKLLAGGEQATVPVLSRYAEAMAGPESEDWKVRKAEAAVKKTARAFVNSDLFDHATRGFFHRIEANGGWREFLKHRMQSGDTAEDPPVIVKLR